MSSDLAKLRRRILIDIARRRQKPGSGSDLAALRRLPLKEWPNLTSILHGLRWAIVGAVAARYYMPERVTQDIDIAVIAESLPDAEARLGAAGFTRMGHLAIGGSQWTGPDGTSLDLIEAAATWWPLAFTEAASNRAADGSPVITAPYLVLMKLQASRVQDIADVTRMLGFMDDGNLDTVRFVVRENAPDLSEDLESLITLGKLEHEG